MWPHTVVVLVLLAAAFALADWYGLLGTRTEQRQDFAHYAYRTVDADTGAPVAAAHVTCTRYGTRSACTERPGGAPGVIELTFGIMRHVEHTLLFERERGLSVSRAGPLNVTFIHPDYERVSLVLDDDDVAAAAREPRRVALPPARE